LPADDYLGKCFSKDPNIVSRKIAGEYILVPIRQSAGDLDSIYTMNAVGGRIWELLDGQRSVSDLKDIIVEEFDVSLEEAEEDIKTFLDQLMSMNVVRSD
jgi:hypothetical protein